MTNEIWRDIEGYEGLYQVSDQGRVKSLKYNKERILKQRADRYGYLYVGLYAGGKEKKHKVHRLVCQAFHENPENKPCVNHIDENKINNVANNLEWCTVAENNVHGSRIARMGKAKSKQVGQYTLDGELVKIWASTCEVKKQTGFNQGCISEAARGNYKTSHGFIWRYV